MTAILLSLAAFASWWLIGLALLVALRADTASLRLVLAAPALGSAVMVLPLFVLSHAGLAMEDVARPVVGALILVSLPILWLRRPHLPPGVVPVVTLCLVNVLLVGRPMFEFGFHWFANANDDMANYVLSATQLLHHGLLGPVDFAALSQGQGYTSTLQPLHNAGSRPGADITLAAYSAVTTRPPYELFMPFIVALQLCGVCAAAALAAQGSRRRWAPTLAAALLVLSPLAAYGVLQQLLPQVWGLGLAAALFALLMRRELHQDPGPRAADVALIGILVAAVVVVYVELASTLALAYGLYVAVLLVRREIDVLAIARLWIPALAIVLALLNTYLIDEIQYVQNQASGGLADSGANKGPPVFGYALVPGALSGLVGLQLLRPDPGAPFLTLSIVVAIAVMLAVLITAFATVARGRAVSAIIITYTALGVLLAVSGADFGAFKLYMYVQPFLAAAVAVWLGNARRAVLAVLAVPLLVVLLAQVSTQRAYVENSRNPVDLRNASSNELLPAFRRLFRAADEPVVSVTDNPVLAKLEAAAADDRPLHFVSSNIFGSLMRVHVERYANGKGESNQASLLFGWQKRSFALQVPGEQIKNPFDDNVTVSQLLSSGRCRLILPTGSQLATNRRTLPEGDPDLIARSCNSPSNFLVFTNSLLGSSFYSTYRLRKDVTFYQLEDDPFYPDSTFSAVGRYLLFRVLGPSREVRMQIDLTTSPLEQNLLPPAAAVGSSREAIPLVGSGSARIFSPPFRPQLIGGQPYVLLDLGRDGRLPDIKRHGLQALYRPSIALDPRFITAYLRDISLVDEADYRRVQAPSYIERIPADLANPNLEYSGIYEDGWVAQNSYVVLAGGTATSLTVRADVLPCPGQHLDVLVNGARIGSKKVGPGSLVLRMDVPASSSRRRIDLRWAGTCQLQPPDRRRAAAHLTFIGLVRTARG